MRPDRRLRLIAAPAAAAAAAVVTAASAAPPQDGVLVPGRSLAGVELSATKAEVRATWGRRFGRCRSCRHETWYFNLRPFRPHGAGVEFRGGGVAAVFTIAAPREWRTSRGVKLGEHVAGVTQVHAPLTRVECGVYYALVLRRARTVTAFYIVDDRLFGFGLMRARLPICR